MAGLDRARDGRDRPPALWIALATCAALVAAATRTTTGVDRQAGELRYDVEYPAIGYSTATPSDRIADLRRRIDAGDVQLTHAGARGYLDALLDALGIDVASQMLVYSRTSLLVGRIHPETPRAIYYNDDTYVAWVQDAGSLEIASMDSALGPVFYTLDQRPGVQGAFRRQTSRCLQCHDSYSLTGGGVPRFITGSGYTDTEGQLVSHEGWILTSDRTPLRSRWGGWYVSGRHGSQVHLGNILVRDPGSLQQLDRLRVGNLDTLDPVLDSSAYLTNTSDIVALMVLEHQTRVQNEITRVNYQVRTELDAAARGDGPEVTPERLETLAEPLVDALLMVGEARLTDRVASTSGFAAAFEARGRTDSRGRSLRQLQLETRLFRYPVSYVIDSPAFDGLPERVRQHVHRRVAAELRDDSASSKAARLSAAERRAVLEILTETRPDFARHTGGT